MRGKIKTPACRKIDNRGKQFNKIVIEMLLGD
jgi:hypothetical protein